MKAKYLWYTDTHLSTVSPLDKIRFLHHLRKEKPDGIFITGDISNGLTVSFELRLIQWAAKCPIYFVLGNHDYYLSSFDKISNKINKACNQNNKLVWLTNSPIIELNKNTALIGTEGWYDGMAGNPSTLKYSSIVDSTLILDLHEKTPSEKLKIFRELAYKSSVLLNEKIEKAIDMGYEHIYLLTHFPPWIEATRDKGKVLESFWLPYNVNCSLGYKLESIMDKNKHCSLTVLAGHVHEDKFIQVSDNILCKVNAAKYLNSLRNEEQIFI